MTLFLTPNRYKRAEVATLLAGLDVTWRRLALPATEGPLRERARRRAEAGYAAVAEPCFVEVAELEAGGQVYTGAAYKKSLARDVDFYETHAGPARTSLAVAYADAEGIDVYEGHLEGTLLAEPRGEGGYGWDRHFVPVGSTRTLAELEAQKRWVNVRVRPYLELADRLRGRRYGGVFEAHVTICTQDRGELERFAELCGVLDLKPIFIELPRGATRFQPMTGSYHHGELPEVQVEVFAIARHLADAGFEVTRVKIEATGSNREIPQTDAEATRAPANYFEFHGKLALPADLDLGELRALCEAHEAHLSRNARRRDGATLTRFVTMRVYGVGQTAARRRFLALHEALRAAGHPLSHVLTEYTVYDSNTEVDAGWLTTSDAT